MSPPGLWFIEKRKGKTPLYLVVLEVSPPSIHFDACTIKAKGETHIVRLYKCRQQSNPDQTAFRIDKFENWRYLRSFDLFSFKVYGWTYTMPYVNKKLV